MNPYAVPALLAGILAALLAAIVWLTQRRSRLDFAFGAFVSGIALASALTFFARSAPTLQGFQRCFAIAVYTQPLVFAAAVYHVLVLSGQATHLRQRVLGLSPRIFVLLSGAIAAASLVVFAVPGWGVRGYVHRGGFGFDAIVSRPAAALVGAQLLGGLWLLGCLLRAERRCAEPAQRRWLQCNIVSLTLILLAALLAGLVLPQLGHPRAPVLIDAAWVLALGVLYVGVLRHHADRYEALNATLESQVEERTQRLKEAQGKLVQTETLASLGKLVAGIVHEVNSPLGVLASAGATGARAIEKLQHAVSSADNVDALREDRLFLRALAVLEGNHGAMSAAGDRLARLVDGLKRFANLDQARCCYVDLHQGLESSLALLGDEIDGRIDVNRDYGDLPQVYGSPGELNQVFMNLLRNAVKAIKGRGRLTITTRAEDNRVAVAISDSGCGIAAERQDRLFDFNFNLQTARVRLGMGLITCYQLVQRHGGKISLRSEEGQGSTFTVVLPARADLGV